MNSTADNREDYKKLVKTVLKKARSRTQKHCFRIYANSTTTMAIAASEISVKAAWRVAALRLGLAEK
jgi:hypothetical protein